MIKTSSDIIIIIIVVGAEKVAEYPAGHSLSHVMIQHLSTILQPATSLNLVIDAVLVKAGQTSDKQHALESACIMVQYRIREVQIDSRVHVLFITRSLWLHQSITVTHLIHLFPRSPTISFPPYDTSCLFKLLAYSGCLGVNIA
jgi:hypothetical protein